MAGLNLLPWREKAREQQKKQFFALLGFTVVIGAAGVFLANMFMQNSIDEQRFRNNYLAQEVAVLDRRIKKIKTIDSTRKALLERMRVIEDLQGTRPAIVHLFDEMVTALPKGMFLKSLDQQGNLIRLAGKAESNARVSSYMNRLDASPWLSSSNLNIISVEKDQKNGVQLRDFKLEVQQKLRQGEGL